MKILHIQASMPAAGNAAFRLSTAMRLHGLESSVLNLSRSAQKEFTSVLPSSNSITFKRIANLINKKIQTSKIKKTAYFYSSLPIFGKKITNHPLVKEADAIYLHWIAGFLSISELEELAETGKPIFFFMHDMWTFTGGCHHSLGCNKYSFSCEHCPMFNWENPFPNKQLEAKKNLFSKYRNLHLISPSKWMASCAKNSVVTSGNIIHVIPNITDETLFKPLNKTLVRQELNLPIDKTIISFGCVAGQENPFKGWKYLEEALQMLHMENIQILIYGSDYNQETVDAIKYPIIFMGRIQEDSVLAKICNASDVFVTPSLCENYSLSILENILCETPVVGFDNTGIPELVITGTTGYLARTEDAEDLAKGIETIIKGIPLKRKEWCYSSKDIIRMHKNLLDYCK